MFLAAVLVAKAVGKPVKTVWTREDDSGGATTVRCGTVPACPPGLSTKGRVRRGSTRRGAVDYGRHRFREGDDRKTEWTIISVKGRLTPQYEIPNLLVSLHIAETGVPVQWWRSVGHSPHGFRHLEVSSTELPTPAGKTPTISAQLLANHPRHRGVLELAVLKAGWGRPLAAAGQGASRLHDRSGALWPTWPRSRSARRGSACS